MQFQRGYCKPEELEEAEREGGEMFDSGDSGGIGEGQGSTDISDQIESQDQVQILLHRYNLQPYSSSY